MRILRWAAPVAAVVLLAAACGGDGSGGDGSGGNASPRSDAPGDLPDHPFEMDDGSSATLADFVGEKPLVLNFFASWCPPCWAEMPDFQNVYADLRDEVGFLGLDIQDDWAGATELVDDTGIEYPWGFHPDAEIYIELGGFGMPTTVYVDADGQVVGKDDGALSEGQLRDRVAEHFGVQS